MPKTVVIPPGTGKPLAPYVPGTLADGVLYVSGTLAFHKENTVVHVGDEGDVANGARGAHGHALKKRRAF